MRLGADRDGKLARLVHEGWEVTSRPGPLQGRRHDEHRRDVRLWLDRDQGQRRPRRSQHAWLHALAAGTALYVRARKRDGRTRSSAGHGPGRIAPRQRYDERADQGPALFEPLADAVLRRRRRRPSAGRTAPRAGLDARRRLADRLGLRDLDLSDADRAGHGARASFAGRPARCRRPRTRSATAPIPSSARRRPNAWAAARQGDGRARRHRAAARAGRRRLQHHRQRDVVVKACDAIRAKLSRRPEIEQRPVRREAAREFRARGRACSRRRRIEPLETAFRQMGQGAIEEYAESVPARPGAGRRSTSSITARSR